MNRANPEPSPFYTALAQLIVFFTLLLVAGNTIGG
jgi:hypothetical protein